ncbi:MAG: HAMP domain-containing sensor histidine kinase [Actinomycetota bacterium]|nr:HAMP domain-containing sensor histidine kinase [Actinomycetota bacterium]
MTRRLFVAIVSVVAVTLLFVAIGFVTLARLDARSDTQDQLRTTIESFAPADCTAADPRSLARFGRRGGPSGREFGIVGVTPDGAVVALGQGPLPGPAPPFDVPTGLSVDLDVISGCDTQTGVVGSRAFAARALGQRPDGTWIVAVLSSPVASVLGPSPERFAVIAVVALALGAAVAWWLGRRFARPVQDVTDAARRIADGDLSVRVPVPAGDDELARAAEAVNDMASSLERSRLLEQQFLMSVSHDLRTPLTSIRGYADALADGTLDDAARGGQVIVAEAARLERLVRDLLDLARLDAREFTLEQRPVDLAPVVEGVVEALRPAATDAGVRIEAHGIDTAVWTVGDHDRLAQVVANLVENGTRHATGLVSVTVEAGDRRGREVRVTVDDDGPGIASEDQPHVFERLYTSRTGPRRGEAGSGLGLAIVRELVAAMSGEVRAESRGTGGARFVVELPAHEDPATVTPPG